MATSVGSVFRSKGCLLRMDIISHQRASTTGEDVSSAKAGKGLQGRSPCRGMWGCPPQLSSPFSWPGEGGQVEDYARRGDEVEHLVGLTSIGWNSPLDRRPRSRMADSAFQSTGTEERITPKSGPFQPGMRQTTDRKRSRTVPS